jgi:hypothetical protein
MASSDVPDLLYGRASWLLKRERLGRPVDLSCISFCSRLRDGDRDHDHDCIVTELLLECRRAPTATGVQQQHGKGRRCDGSSPLPRMSQQGPSTCA